MTDNEQASFEYCPSCAGELDTGFECKQCGRDWRPWATMQLADEVQRRMDQVVEAAVEWHQAGREGGEWFDAAEKLSATIDSLLALRNVPAAATGLRKCRKCGHSKASPDDGLCDELLPYVKKEPFGMEMCGCKCEFAAPVATTADNEGEEFAKIDALRLSGCNVTFWCTPRAVVTQVAFHDEDASPDIDKSFPSLKEAISFAAALRTQGEGK